MTLDIGGRARGTDPTTSHDAARKVRPGSARAALLLAHARADDEALSHPGRIGLTDEEACTAAGLSLASEYATRCSELERAGYLRDTSLVRIGHSGMGRMVRVITDSGYRTARGLGHGR